MFIGLCPVLSTQRERSGAVGGRNTTDSTATIYQSEKKKKLTGPGLVPSSCFLHVCVLTALCTHDTGITPVPVSRKWAAAYYVHTRVCV